MSDIVPAADIERIVGAPRHEWKHIARAVSEEQCVYILHSHECIASCIDLRDCEFSIALDAGIDPKRWPEDVALTVEIIRGQLTPTGWASR